jgi:hypothetical protein
VLNLLPSSEKLTIKKGKKIGLSGYQRDRKEVDDAYSKLGNRFESVY